MAFLAATAVGAVDRDRVRAALAVLALSFLFVLPLAIWQLLLLHGDTTATPDQYLRERAALDAFTLRPLAWDRIEAWRALDPLALLAAAVGIGASLRNRWTQAALAGTGSPSALDRYVSESDPRNTNARSPVPHGTTHTVGLDAKYTEVDVRQSAYIMTGRTVDRDSRFSYDKSRHWTGPAPTPRSTRPATRPPTRRWSMPSRRPRSRSPRSSWRTSSSTWSPISRPG